MEEKLLCKGKDCTLKNFCARYTDYAFGIFMNPIMKKVGKDTYCGEYTSITGSRNVKRIQNG